MDPFNDRLDPDQIQEKLDVFQQGKMNEKDHALEACIGLAGNPDQGSDQGNKLI